MNEHDSPLNERNKATISSGNHAEQLDVTTLPKNNHAEPIDTSAIDEQWAEMTQDWQSQSYTKTDIDKLLKQTKQRTFWAKCLLAIDIIATVGIIFTALYMWLSGSKDRATTIYLGGAGVFSIVFVFYAIKVRLFAWRVNSGCPDKAIEHAINGCESSIHYIKLIKFSCYVIWPFAHWYLFAVAEQLDKSPLSSLVFINALTLIIWFVSDKYHQKRMAELKQLKNVLSK